MYDYFRQWRNAGIWEGMVRTLRERLRVQAIDGFSQGIHKLENYARSHGLNSIECSVADVREVQLAFPFLMHRSLGETLSEHWKRRAVAFFLRKVGYL